jgi:nicotinate-nucleotide adenylyltransferase
VEIALVGGSFNPPHVGHLWAATFVRATQAVDQVWLVPAFRHPFGKALVDYEHRLRMCELLCADASGWLIASDAERQVGGEGWTVELLRHLTRTRPGDRFTLVIGSDILKDLPKWHAFDEIQRLARVLVLHRAGYPAIEAVGPPMAEIASSDIRDAIARGELPEGWVPRTVLEYVTAYRLYGYSSATPASTSGGSPSSKR